MARRIIDAGIVEVFLIVLNTHAASTDFILECFRLLRLLAYGGLTAPPENRTFLFRSAFRSLNAASFSRSSRHCLPLTIIRITVATVDGSCQQTLVVLCAEIERVSLLTVITSMMEMHRVDPASVDKEKQQKLAIQYIAVGTLRLLSIHGAKSDTSVRGFILVFWSL